MNAALSPRVDGEHATGVHWLRYDDSTQCRRDIRRFDSPRREAPSHVCHRQPASRAILNLPHHRSRVLVFILDRFYHIIRWFVLAIPVGAILYGAIGALLVTGQSGLADPRTWPSIQLILAYPEWSLGIGVPLLLLTALGWIAHLTGLAHPQPAAPVSAGDIFTTTPVKALKLTDFKLGPNPSEAYYERAAFTLAREALRAAIAGPRTGASASSSSARPWLARPVSPSMSLSRRRVISNCSSGPVAARPSPPPRSNTSVASASPCCSTTFRSSPARTRLAASSTP